MVSRIHRLTRPALTLFLAAILACALGCGSDDPPAPALNINVFGWGPDLEGNVGFVSGVPSYSNANDVSIRVSQPLQRRLLAEQTFALAAHSGVLPEVPFGEQLRLDFSVLDVEGNAMASGSTPRFDFKPEDGVLTFRVQVGRVGEYAPVGAVFRDKETGDNKFAQSRFDYRGTEKNWLGRIGASTAPTRDGKVLVVGGGDPVPGFSLGAVPKFRDVHADIQVYDPRTGYFTDLSFDDEASATDSQGVDELVEPVAFHSVTPIGGDRFLVAGGFTPREDSMRPTSTIQVIDLNAPAGTRVQKLVDASGNEQSLSKARGWHSATYRSSDGTVIVAGGIGPGGDTDVLSTFEIVDIEANSVLPQPGDMIAPRVEHTATLMPDGQTIWLTGGRDDSGVLGTTEVIEVNEGGTTIARPEADLAQARFGHAGLRVAPGGGKLLAVMGGFTDLEGSATGSYELSSLGRGRFESGQNWTLNHARGRLSAVELPVSSDIIVLGGRDSDGLFVSTAERLEFDDLTADSPYAAQDRGDAIDTRYMGNAHLLTSGQILVVGGLGKVDGSTTALDTAAVFIPDNPIESGGVVVVTE